MRNRTQSGISVGVLGTAMGLLGRRTGLMKSARCEGLAMRSSKELRVLGLTADVGSRREVN